MNVDNLESIKYGTIRLYIGKKDITSAELASKTKRVAIAAGPTQKRTLA